MLQLIPHTNSIRSSGVTVNIANEQYPQLGSYS